MNALSNPNLNPHNPNQIYDSTQQRWDEFMARGANDKRRLFDQGVAFRQPGQKGLVHEENMNNVDPAVPALHALRKGQIGLGHEAINSMLGGANITREVEDYLKHQPDLSDASNH